MVLLPDERARLVNRIGVRRCAVIVTDIQHRCVRRGECHATLRVEEHQVGSFVLFRHEIVRDEDAESLHRLAGGKAKCAESGREVRAARGRTLARRVINRSFAGCVSRASNYDRRVAVALAHVIRSSAKTDRGCGLRACRPEPRERADGGRHCYN